MVLKFPVWYFLSLQPLSDLIFVQNDIEGCISKVKSTVFKLVPRIRYNEGKIVLLTTPSYVCVHTIFLQSRYPDYSCQHDASDLIKK